METIASILASFLMTALFHSIAKRDRKIQAESPKDLEQDIKRLSSRVCQRVLGNTRISEEELASISNLFWRDCNDPDPRLRGMIEGEFMHLTVGTSFEKEGREDVYSRDRILRTLQELREQQGIKNLSDETLFKLLPELIISLLQEIASKDKLSNYVLLVQNSLILEKLERIEKRDDLDPEEILKVVREYLERQYKLASAHYVLKLTGSDRHLSEYFPYLPPRIRLVKRIPSGLPQEIERDSLPITYQDLKSYLKDSRVNSNDNRGLFVVAGAGVGKTTFLLHLYLDLLYEPGFLNAVPCFADAKSFLQSGNSLWNWARPLQTESTGRRTEKADQVFRTLYDIGKLCVILDSLDQSGSAVEMDQRHLRPLSGYGDGYLGSNRIVVACRREDIGGNPDLYRRVFRDFEWIILEKFSEEELKEYLGDKILDWLDFEHMGDKDFKELMRTRFYANTAKRIGLRPEKDRPTISNRKELLQEFEKELFLDAEYRDIKITNHQRDRIKQFLRQLSLDTLSNKPEPYRQTFPMDYVGKYRGDFGDVLDILTDNTQWIYPRIFDLPGKNEYSFIHQLLQEYFAACALWQRFTDEHKKGFANGLENLPWSQVIPDLLDEMLTDHEAVYEYCMGEIEEALRKKASITDSGHFFTWVLALRNLKCRRPGLRKRLQEFFDNECQETQRNALTDGNLVRVPEGSFLMGAWEFGNSQPVRVVYVPEFWISRYTVTLDEYDAYCKRVGKNKLPDQGWGRGKRPVINVTWKEADEYCKALGEGYSLPDEAQWEKAARGCYGRHYPWGNEEPDEGKARFREKDNRGTVEVDKYDPWLYGIHQMAGNVWEWCADLYRECYGPDALIEDKYRVLRGGCWLSQQWDMRSALRDRIPFEDCDDFVGFRVLRKK